VGGNEFVIDGSSIGKVSDYAKLYSNSISSRLMS